MKVIFSVNLVSTTLCLTYVSTSHTTNAAAAASVANTTNIYCCAGNETYIYRKLPDQTAQWDVSNKDWPS
jgi:hypothetical protein